MWDMLRDRFKVLTDNLNEETYKKLVKSEKNRKRIFIGGSVLAGIAAFVLFMDIIVMPLYLQEGVAVRVPDITNKTIDQAEIIARQSQLTVIADSTDFSEFIQKGMIASQKPLPGIFVKPGRRIHLVISKGSQMVKVPDISGLSPVDAEKVIQNAGLVVENKRYRTSKKFSSGTVMNQFPDAGTKFRQRPE